MTDRDDVAGRLSEHRSLQIALAAYQADRQADQNAIAASMALIGAGAAVTAAAGFVLLTQDSSTPGWIVALLPIPPLPLIATALLHNNTASIRGHYLSLLERQLQRLVDREVCPFPTPAGFRLSARVWQSRLGRLGQTMIYLPLLGLYAALVVDSVRLGVKLHESAIAYCSLAIVAVGIAVLLTIYLKQWTNAEAWRRFVAENEALAASHDRPPGTTTHYSDAAEAVEPSSDEPGESTPV